MIDCQRIIILVNEINFVRSLLIFVKSKNDKDDFRNCLLVALQCCDY